MASEYESSGDEDHDFKRPEEAGDSWDDTSKGSSDDEYYGSEEE